MSFAAFAQGNGKPPQDSVPARVNKLEAVTVKTHRPPFVQKIDRLVVNVGSLLSASGASAVEVLEAIPGLTLDDNGALTLRGRSGLTIYVDGRRIYLSGQELVNYLRSLPAASLETAEVFANPPAGFPAEGAGGVIRLITKRPKSEGWNGYFSQALGQGKYSRINSNALVDHHGRRWSFFTGIGFSELRNYYEYDRYRSYTYGDGQLPQLLAQTGLERNHKENYTYRAGLDHTPSPATMLSFYAEGLASPYGETGIYRNDLNFADPLKDYRSVSYSGMHAPTQDHTFSLAYRHDDALAHRLTVNLEALLYHLRQEQLLNTVADSAGAQEEQLHTVNPFSATIYSLRSDYTAKLYGFSLETGLQSLLSLRRSEGLYQGAAPSDPIDSLNNRVQYREAIQSVYASLRREWKRLGVQAGLRLEDTYVKNEVVTRSSPASFSLHYLRAFPTVFIQYKLDSIGDALTLSFGRRINRPGYQSLNPSLFLFDRNTGHGGNSLLRPAFTTALELSYAHRSWLILSFGYNRSRDDIELGYLRRGGALINIPQNLDQYENLNTNVTVTLKPVRWWSFTVNGEAGHSRYAGADISTGLELATGGYYARFSGSQNIFLPKGWQLEASGQYRTRLPGWESYGLPLGQLHVAVEKKFSEKASLRVAVRDVLHSWRIRRRIVVPGVTVNTYLESDSRWANLVFTYRFGKAVKRERTSGIEGEAGRL